jgi:hypothetical protein
LPPCPPLMRPKVPGPPGIPPLVLATGDHAVALLTRPTSRCGMFLLLISLFFRCPDVPVSRYSTRKQGGRLVAKIRLTNDCAATMHFTPVPRCSGRRSLVAHTWIVPGGPGSGLESRPD